MICCEGGDCVDHCRHVEEDVLVREAEDREAFGFEGPGAGCVMLRLIFALVHVAIDFDGQMQFGAVEVQDEAGQGMLPPEPQSRDLVPAAVPTAPPPPQLGEPAPGCTAAAGVTCVSPPITSGHRKPLLQPPIDQRRRGAHPAPGRLRHLGVITEVA